MAQIVNDGLLSAKYDDVIVEARSHVTVKMPAVTLIKTASLTMWTGDEMTYTVTAHNIEDEETGKPATTVVFTDTINPKLATLVEGSVTIDDAPAPPADVQFDPDTGKLTVNLPDIDPDVTITITFRVKKV